MDIKKIVNDYIKAENTDYAIMVTGVWGSGKTFCWNHTLKQAIEEIKIPGQDTENAKKYSSARVSLFGLTDVNQIRQRTLEACVTDKVDSKLFSFVKNKKTIIGRIVSGLTRKAAKKYADIEEEEISFLDEVRNRYYGGNNPSTLGASRAIMEYIKTGELNEVQLETEIQNSLSLIRNQMGSKTQQLLGQMNQFLILEDAELRKLADGALQGIRNHEYDYFSYPIIFHYLQTFITTSMWNSIFESFRDLLQNYQTLVSPTGVSYYLNKHLLNILLKIYPQKP